jgi:hypothetical protein
MTKQKFERYMVRRRRGLRRSRVRPGWRTPMTFLLVIVLGSLMSMCAFPP